MKFRVEHSFKSITLPGYEALFFDEPFNVALCTATHLSRAMVKREFNDGKLVRELRVGPDREVPGPVAKVLGANRIEYIEKINYKAGSYEGTWETVPMVMADKVVSRGTFRFYTQGDRVVRVVEGDVSVKIFGLGGVIEKLVVADVERSYNQAADFTQTWISTQKVPEKLA